MKKTEVYSWRLDPELKSSLEHAARVRGRSVSRLLEEIVGTWLHRDLQGSDEEEVQRRLHAAARESFGTLQSGDPDLAEQAGSRVRRKLRERHAAGRPG